MTANRRNINDLRYLARNNLIIPDNLDILKIERLPIRNPDFPQSPRQPLYKEKLRNLPKLRKVERNTKLFCFYFRDRVTSPSKTAELRKVERNTKHFLFYFRDRVTSPSKTAKLLRSSRCSGATRSLEKRGECKRNNYRWNAMGSVYCTLTGQPSFFPGVHFGIFLTTLTDSLSMEG